MGIPVKTPTIDRHPLRDAYMVTAPEEVNPLGVPFIGTRRECEKALTHMKKLARAYAKAHSIVVLNFLKERNSGALFAIAVKEKKRIDGTLYYTFGRLYHVFGAEFTYDQCGCATFEDEMEVRKAAYKHFGIK